MIFSSNCLCMIKATDIKPMLLKKIYGRMEKEDLVKTVFYDGYVSNPDAFVEFATSQALEMRIVLYNDKEKPKSEFGYSHPVGIVWINNPIGHVYMIHFCILSDFWKHQVDIGIWTVKQYLEPINPITKKPYISALYGLTPAVYSHAINFIKNIGFRILGVLPSSCEFKASKSHKYRDGVVSSITLADLKQYNKKEV